MVKLLNIVLLLISSSAFGIGMSINSVPIFYSVLGENPVYRDACYKAQEAFFIQIGATQKINAVQNLLSQKATYTVTYIIEKNTSMKAKDVFVVMGIAYTLAIKKEISQRFRSPLSRRVYHTVSVGTNKVYTGIEIPF